MSPWPPWHRIRSASCALPPLLTPPARAGSHAASSTSAASCSWAMPCTSTIVAIGFPPTCVRCGGGCPDSTVPHSPAVVKIAVMAGRLALVIGSQCNTLQPLSFVEELAGPLATALAEAGWEPTGADKGLLLNPDVGPLKTAVKSAFSVADDATATLLVAFVGHGVADAEQDLYLLARDSPATNPDSDTAVHFAQFYREQLKQHVSLDGLVLLVDACQAQEGVAGAGARWTDGAGRQRRPAGASGGLGSGQRLRRLFHPNHPRHLPHRPARRQRQLVVRRLGTGDQHEVSQVAGPAPGFQQRHAQQRRSRVVAGAKPRPLPRCGHRPARRRAGRPAHQPGGRHRCDARNARRGNRIGGTAAPADRPRRGGRVHPAGTADPPPTSSTPSKSPTTTSRPQRSWTPIRPWNGWPPNYPPS